MAAVSPRLERRRPRPGSLERPVNGRLYRGTWLLVGLPLLVAAFSVARPKDLPRSFLPAFDGATTKRLASELATQYPNRYPGSLAAADWVRDQLTPYGLPVRTEHFSEVIPGHGRVHLRNLVAEAVGRSPHTIIVMAHRDNDGRGPGANDNASGTAMLIQLARAYSSPPGVSAAPLRPNHTILFLSTDGGAFGGLGAAWFATHSPLRHDVAAVVNLDSVAGSGRIRIELAGDTPRTPSGTLVETATARVAAQIGRAPARATLVRQLVDLGFPYSLYEQAPLIAHGAGAVTLTTAGDNPPDPLTDTKDRLHAEKLTQVGRSAQDLLGTLDEGVEFAQGTSSFLYLGSRLIRGWAIELVLIACLLPFLAAAVDLFARCRRRRIPLRPALLALATLALLVVATNPFALLFLLPSLHAWLWLPQVRRATAPLRLGVLMLGFAGPALLLGEFAGRYGLGWDAPWYLAELRAVGYVPFIVMPLLVVWFAGAGQLSALATRRYGPYPDAAELPPRGPVRRILRRTYLAVRDRRRGEPEVALASARTAVREARPVVPGARADRNGLAGCRTAQHRAPGVPLPRRVEAQRGDRTAPRAADGREHDRRQRHRPRQPHEGAGPRPAHVHARRE